MTVCTSSAEDLLAAFSAAKQAGNAIFMISISKAGRRQEGGGGR